MKKHKKHIKREKGFVRLSFLLLWGIFLMVIPCFAQQSVSVKGTVLDTNKDPVIAATVQEVGNYASVVQTDLNGKFSIRVSKPNAMLRVTYVGMNTVNVNLEGKTSITIIMQDDNVKLDDVVVTALGIKKQTKALGYAVAEVKGDDITKGGDNNAITALSGRVAGVDISTGAGGPSGSTRVIIRGSSQLSGSNQPLYVVDGVPMDNTQMDAFSTGKSNQYAAGYDMGDGLAAINPADIESVSVLKGASASALYGSRASNGVVMITTKSGAAKKSGLGIDFSTQFNVVKILSGFNDYQRVYGQGANGEPSKTMLDAQGNTQSSWGGKLDPNIQVPIYNGEMKSYGNRNDNILRFFRTGSTLTNTLALYNSNDNANYRLSASNMRNNDIVPSSTMYRNTFMLNGGATLGKNLKVEGRANYTKEGVNNRPALADAPNNIGNSIIGIAPNFDQKWLSENYKDELGRYTPWNGNKYRLNPYWVINEMTNKSHKDRFLGYMQANYQILPCLSAQAKVGTDLNKTRFTEFTPMYTDGVEAGQMQEISVDIQETNYEGIIRFNKSFLENKLDVSAFVGGNIMMRQYERFLNKGMTQIIPDMQSIGNYKQKELVTDFFEKQVNSVYGSVDLGYRSFLYAGFTLRNDKSSTLKKGNNSYTYPSLSGSFVFSELGDFSKFGLNFGKLRASWAKVGGDTDPYQLYNDYYVATYTVQNYALGQIASSTLRNIDLKPTSTYSYEVGLDLRFFANRLSFDLGYFHQLTENQIMPLPVSVATGYESVMINAGKIENKGVELAVTGIPVKTKDFEWTMNVNLSKLENKVKELHPDVDTYELSAARWAGASVVARVGERFGAIMGTKFARNENGDVIYGTDGLPTYESEVSILGNGNYDFTMGIGNTFLYKDFSLSFLIDMKFGGDIYSMSAWNSYYNGTSKNTLEGRKEWYQSEEARKAAGVASGNWTPTGGYVGQGVVADGNGGWVKNTTPVDPQLYWRNVSDKTPEPSICDASYIKLREVSLTYNLPKKMLAKSPVRALSLSAYGRNLWIIHTKLKNIDPESSYNMSNGQGLEYGSLPSRRTFGLSLNVKF